MVISFLGTSMTLEAVIKLEALCLQLQERRDLDAIVLLVPKSDKCDVSSETTLL